MKFKRTRRLQGDGGMWMLEKRNKRKIQAVGMKFFGSIEGKTRRDSIRNEIELEFRIC